MSDFGFVGSDGGTRGYDYSFQYDGQQQDTPKEITKKHWVNKDDRPYCKAKLCKKKFSLIDRHHHCRRCGEVFCADCLKYTRRLNFLAHFDPQGKLYKVCLACFGEGHDTDVPTRSLTGMFRTLKLHGRRQHITAENANSSRLKSWRDKLDMPAECERLKTGFLQCVNKSDVTRALKEMSLMVKTPDWQKSATWMQESMADKCQFCSVGFGLLTKKQACKLCGRVMCKKCSNKELLLYIPNDDLHVGMKQYSDVCLSVIRIVGSPEMEPDVSMLLHMCDFCKQYVSDLQVAKVERIMEAEVKVIDTEVISRLIVLDGTMVKLQDKINNQLTMYQEVVESLEDGSRSSSGNNNTKVLAKAQDDLSDYFSTLCIKIPVIKKLVPEADTDTRRKLLNSYLRAKSDFYLDNVHTFRVLRRKLSESATPEMLEYIQKIVDKHAIVSAQIYIRQLTFESINLCVKHSLDSELVPKLLTRLDEIIEEEANKCLISQGDDLDAHSQYLREIVHTQMKDHKLIRTSKRQLATSGSKHAVELLMQRLLEILYQVTVQLDMKSINRSFQKTKSGLEIARKEAEGLTHTDLLVKTF